MKLGAFEIHTVSDGSFLLDGGADVWRRSQGSVGEEDPADARNRIRLSLTCLLIQTGRENILVETGIGDKFGAKFQDDL